MVRELVEPMISFWTRQGDAFVFDCLILKLDLTGG
jgi:hypothetical protein